MKVITFFYIVRDGEKGFSKSESMSKYRLNPQVPVPSYRFSDKDNIRLVDFS